MQKAWIAVSLALVLLVGGLGGGLWVMRQNKPAPFWLELPVREGTSTEDVDRMIAALRVSLTGDEVLRVLVKEAHLVERWKLADEGAAMAELRKRIYVRRADVAGKFIIGVQGKRKEMAATKSVTDQIGKMMAEMLEKQKQRGAQRPADGGSGS